MFFKLKPSPPKKTQQNKFCLESLIIENKMPQPHKSPVSMYVHWEFPSKVHFLHVRSVFK